MLDLLVRFRRLLVLRLALFLLTLAEAQTQSPAGVADDGPEKSAYALFHPTPRDPMRELSPDRPDKTGNPHTVDAGRLQFFRNSLDSDCHNEFIQSVTVSHALVGKLDSYLEFFSHLGTEPHSSWAATVDAVVTYLVRENIQLDGGCNFGVTRAADDFNPFAGIAIRF